MLVASAQHEEDHPYREYTSGNILVVLILSSRYDFTHQHDRDHFPGLRDHLVRERHVLQRLVLTPRTKNVRE